MTQLKEERIAHIQKELAYAQAGDHAAKDRIFNFHLPFLISETRRLNALAFPVEEALSEEVAEAVEEIAAVLENDQNEGPLDNEELEKVAAVEATLAAESLATEQDVDITQVPGTGTGGKVTVGDVRAFLEAGDEDSGDVPDSAAHNDGENE